jgi:alkyl sulfatase BDS1-like metallo-beta-lactamase superfamily hydrolase
VRDAKAWSFYIDEALAMFAGDSEVLFASHHWPRWGKPDAVRFLKTQRDVYKYVHDQTLRMANHGRTPREIAEELKLPPTLAAEWHVRDYYGTLNHNAKAVYQRYLGWFDGNPASLHPLPPVETGRRYVELAGGAEPLLAKARAAYEAGDYRWVAEVVNHLVFADPDNEAARALQADALEQLGYQAESGPWRAFYLTGAQELRSRRPPAAAPRQAALAQLPRLPGAFLLDSLSVRLNGPKVGASTLKLGVHFSDTGEKFLVEVENAVMRHYADRADPDAPTITLARPVLVQLISGEKTIEAAVADGALAIEGDAQPLAALLAWLDRFDFWFELIEP